MWEVKKDGKRKLKINATPTLFSQKRFPGKLCAPSMTVGVESRAAADVIRHDSPIKRPQVLEPGILPVLGNSSMEIELEAVPLCSTRIVQTFSKFASTSSSSSSLATLQPFINNEDLLPQIKMSDKKEKNYLTRKYKTVLLKLKMCRKSLLKEKSINKKLQRKIVDLENTNAELNMMKKIFNKDQIEWIARKEQKLSTNNVRWSDITIRKALKLKFSCGGSG